MTESGGVNGDGIVFKYDLIPTPNNITMPVANDHTIHPNPSTGKFVVETKAAGGFELEVYNLTGQHIRSASSSGTTMQIDLAQYPKGTYFIRISGKGQTRTTQIIIQ
jgi:hypothetical protein